MKTIRLLIQTLPPTLTLSLGLALGLPTAALSQSVIHLSGAVSFQNTETAVQGVTSHLVVNIDGTLLVGTQYRAELYYLNTDTGNFSPLPATISPFRASTTSRPGAWVGPSPIIPFPDGYGGVDIYDDGSGEVGDGTGTGLGYYPLALRIRVWDSTTGGSWETAGVKGELAPFTYTQRHHEPPAATDNQMITQPGFQLLAGSAPPIILVQPKGQSGYWGKSVSFSVVAKGSPPALTYQWFKNYSPLDWATESILTVTNLDLSAGGDYTVVVSNSAGSVTSNPALLILNAAGISIGLYPGITIDGVVGNTYGIQYTTDITHTTSWITLTNLTLTEPVQLWLDTSPDAMVGTAPRRSYRVVAVP